MKKIKLGDIAEIVTGPFGSQLHACDYTTNGIPYIMPKDIGERFIIEDNISRISTSDAKRLRRYQLSLGDIIYSRRGDIEKCALIKPENVGALCGTGCIRVRPNSIKVMPLFLSLYLGQPHVRKWIVSHAVGATMPNLNSDILKQLPIKLPSIAEQNKIAAILDALDAKIALNKKINASLEAMAKTLYDYWFVQFDFPDEYGKPYKSSGGKMIYSSELGRDIPTDWAVDTLEGKITITRGISYSTETLSANAKGIPMINLASVDRKRNYIPNGLKFFIGDVPNEKKLQAMDMLIACTDLTRQAEIIGSPILVMNDREYTFSMDLAKLTVTDEKLNELYLYMTLRTNFYHQYIVGFASGTTVLHLNTSGIEWYKVLIPPTTLQEKFAVVMKNIYLQTCKNICENQRLAELRDWLLPMLMNGQVKLKK